MKLNTLSLAPLTAAVLMLCGTAAHAADWTVSADPLVVTAAPKNLQVQPQNPPTFMWPRHASNPPGYTVEVKLNGAVVQTYAADRNWYLPTKGLAAGTYTWHVRPSNSTNVADWSPDRSFVINSTSLLFEVPSNADLRTAIVGTPRPRGLQRGLPLFSNWGSSIKAERTGAYNSLDAEVEWFFAKLPGVKDSMWPLVTNGSVASAAFVAQTNGVRTAIYANGRQLEAAALMYRLTGLQKFLTEALSRGDQLAALNVEGPTSYANQDQGTRVISLSLIKAVDSLGTALDATRRATWLKAVELRTNDMYADLSGSNGRMDQYPFDSHGGTNLGFLALISVLSLGDIPSADTWFNFAFRDYVATTSAWSGPEGGYADGTAYAQYTADFDQQIWQPMVQATGINMFSKPWSLGFLRFFEEFVPPASVRHVYGDQNEVVPTYNILKGYASHYSTPDAAWYFSHITGDMDSLTLLEAPYPLPVNLATSLAPPPNAQLFPGIGWAAMHNNMSIPTGTSLYFKSSQYGSYNHSHADQNSFLLQRGGVPLLWSSGYDDYYGSPLWSSWYRQTKAHNGITYDGGLGQVTDGYTPAGYNRTMAFPGNIMSFSTTPALDYVAGEAGPTYNGVLTQASRKMWYLRTLDAVVVMDNVASAAAHVFEWNFHALAPIVTDTSGNASISYKGQTVCLSPIEPAGLNLVKRVGPPPQTGVIEDHAAYVTTAPVKQVEFLTLIDVGCKKLGAKLQSSSSGRTVLVGPVGNQMSIVLPN